MNKVISKKLRANALREVANLLDEKGWCRHKLKNKQGEMCLLGGVRELFGKEFGVSCAVRADMHDYIINNLDGRAFATIPTFNDTVLTNKKEAMSFLRKVASALEHGWGRRRICY